MPVYITDLRKDVSKVITECDDIKVLDDLLMRLLKLGGQPDSKYGDASSMSRTKARELKKNCRAELKTCRDNLGLCDVVSEYIKSGRLDGQDNALNRHEPRPKRQSEKKNEATKSGENNEVKQTDEVDDDPEEDVELVCNICKCPKCQKMHEDCMCEIECVCGKSEEECVCGLCEHIIQAMKLL